MKRMSRSAAILWLLGGMTLLGSTAAVAAVDLVTEPERCVFLGRPYRMALHPEANLVLMVNGGGVYAFDIASGAQRWHRYLRDPYGGCGATFGKRQVLGWSDQGVFLLDAATGRETWWRRDTQFGRTFSASLSPDETQVLLDCERGCILYGLADRSQRVLPKQGRMGLCGWLDDNKTLLFSQDDEKDNNSPLKWVLMNVGSGVITPAWKPPYSRTNAFPMLSARGEMAEGADDGDNTAALKVLDARTGAVLREFKNIPGPSGGVYWLPDAKRLVFSTADRTRARVMDAETGAVLFSLSQEGHRFATYAPCEDGQGNAWFFSRDDANNQYAWPLTPDGAPRKVLDGTRVAPGYFYFPFADQCRVMTGATDEDRVSTQIIYALEDMRKLGEWHCRLPESDWSSQRVNRALTHCVSYYPVGHDRRNRPQNMAFSVHVQDSEIPVRKGQGRVMAISPDAHWLALQTDEKISFLYDVQADRIVSQYVAPNQENNYNYMEAAFSDDGRHLVVNTSESLEVTDLADGFARLPLATVGEKRLSWVRPSFSSDGTRVLCAGDGRAWLFDAESGALLHTLEETERFANLYPQGNGFWGGLLSTARDWAGLVTDRFKWETRLEASFADGGTRVITHAAGQIIRVWDAVSGKLLQTIHTELPEKRDREGYIRNHIFLSATGRFAFCCNDNGFAPAALWSVADGAPLRHYQLPESSWTQVMPLDDGTAVYVRSNDNLYRWAGVPGVDDGLAGTADK